MGGLAGTGALAVAALPTITAPTDAYHRLIRLCHRWQSLERAFVRALNRMDDAIEAQGPLPPVPEILQHGFDVWPDCTAPNCGHAVKPSDMHMIDGYGYGTPAFVSRTELEDIARGRYWLEPFLVPGYEPVKEGRGQGLVAIPEESRAKAREYLAAHDQWEAARKARTALAEHWEAKQDRIHELQAKVSEQIAELPATTMQGLNAKLSIVAAEPLYAEDQGIAASALEDTRRIDTAARLSPPVAA